MTMHRRNLRHTEIEENKEEFRLIWLDAGINDSYTSVDIQTKLLELNSVAQFYTDSDRCIDLIKSIEGEQVLLVISRYFAQIALSQIHHLRYIVAVFIFDTNRRGDTSLTNQYEKIVGIFIDQDSLMKSLRQTINLLNKQIIAFRLFGQGQNTSRNLSKDSPSFLWYQMLLHVLKQMPRDKKSEEDMLKICETYYQFDKAQKKMIEKFRNKYDKAKAIEWYKEECFLYRLLNRALRIRDAELLYKFRSFIIDLSSAIENKKLDNGECLKLYRGQTISVEELEELKQNVGSTISVNTFFSTSRDIKVARVFTSSVVTSANYKSVLFEICADPSVRTAVFADVSQCPQIGDEQEVLFTLNSLFKIISVGFDSTLKMWKIRLLTTDEGSMSVEKHFESIEHGMDYYSPIVYFGRLLLYELGQTDQAEKYLKVLLKSLPPDHPDIASVYNWIGVVHHKKKS